MIHLILVLGLILRLINLDQSLWLDEAISALAARDYSFFGIIKDFIPGDTHPPLYYLILKFWASIWEFSEISLRIPSVLFGVATIFILYKISQKSLIPALLLATSGLHIYYSQEVRMYALSTLLVSLAVYFFLKKSWKLFSLSLLLIGLTDYLPLLIIPVFLIYSLIQKSELKKLFLSCIPLGFFLLLWSPVFLEQSLGTTNYLLIFPEWRTVLGSANLKELALVWVKFIIGRISFEPKIFYVLIVLFTSSIFGYLLFKSLKNLKKLGLFWLWLVVPTALAFLGSFFVPGFSYFRLIFVLPAFYILIAFGIKTKFQKVLVFLIVLINLLTSLTYLMNSKFWREDWKAAVVFVETRIQPNEVVLMSFPEPFAPWRWYSKEQVEAIGVVDLMSTVSAIENKSGIYYFEYLSQLTDPNEVVKSSISQIGYSKVETYDFRGVGFIEHWQKD